MDEFCAKVSAIYGQETDHKVQSDKYIFSDITKKQKNQIAPVVGDRIHSGQNCWFGAIDWNCETTCGNWFVRKEQFKLNPQNVWHLKLWTMRAQVWLCRASSSLTLPPSSVNLHWIQIWSRRLAKLFSVNFRFLKVIYIFTLINWLGTCTCLRGTEHTTSDDFGRCARARPGVWSSCAYTDGHSTWDRTKVVGHFNQNKTNY